MIAGLLLAIFMGKWVAGGQLVMPGLVIGAIFGAIFFLTLGRMYWYMIPFALASGLPAIPLGGRTVELGELFIAVSTAIFIARVAMKKSTMTLFRVENALVLICFVWICMVWCVNPTGFIFFGSETIGGRFYLKIVLGFCAFVIMASQEPEEKDFNRIIVLVLVGIIIKTALEYGTFRFFGTSTSGDSPEGFDAYTWQQALSWPAMLAAYYLFSRYKPSEIFGFQRPWTVMAYGASIFLALLSGKRIGLLLVLLTPILGGILYKQYRYIIIAAIIFSLGAFFVSTGQGNLFRLPYTAQRALSWLPADWEPDVRELGTSDKFRELLRQYAIEEIQRSPLIGKGYSVTVSDILTGMNMEKAEGSLEVQRLAGHAISRNWHNTWLGYSADFGIPFTVFYISMLLQVLILSFLLVQRLPHPTAVQVFCGFAFYMVAMKIIAIHTGGHAATDIFENWWIYGLVFSIYRNYLKGGLAIQQRKPMS